MKLQPLLAIVFAALWLIGCAGGGPMLAEPTVTQTDVRNARSSLSTHQIEPSRDLRPEDMRPTLNRIWNRLKYPVRQTCEAVFSSGCDRAVANMKVRLVRDNSVNAYADAHTFTIGVHTGLMRSAGSDDEIAWVLTHEAAHLLFGHAQKKTSNAASGALMGAIALGALGAALHPDPEYVGDMTQTGFNTGYVAGYLAYSPEMELEADQFAAYVMARDGRRLSAGLDTIVRLHRGDVPAPVRRGEGWAGYLSTHPANDYRLAAMRDTLGEIQRGATRPLTKAATLEQEEERRIMEKAGRLADIFEREECIALMEEYPDCKWWQGKYDWLYITRCPSPFGHACK